MRKKALTPFFGSYQFTKKGAYDIFAGAYDENSTLFSKASKRLIIGEECDIHRIIEFELTDGSFNHRSIRHFCIRRP